MIAPALRSLAVTQLSFKGCEPARALEPAVVLILSCVSILSFNITGTPNKAHLACPLANRLSSESAIIRASGLITIMEFK